MKAIKRNPAGVGALCVAASAVLFGATPLLAALSYAGGNNGVNMAFLRALLPLPVLMALGGKTRCTKAEWLDSMALGLLLFGCALLLYSSYAYLPVGLATSLHFLYPLYVSLYEAVAQKKPLTPLRIAGLICGLAGVACFLEGTAGGGPAAGFALALLSGLCYSGYIIVLGRGRSGRLPSSLLIRNISVCGVALCGAVGLLGGKLTFSLTAEAWRYAALAALLAAAVACRLFQHGVRLVGESTAALLSLFEPLCSVLLGFWLLREPMSPLKWLGCLMILCGVCFTIKGKAPAPSCKS